MALPPILPPFAGAAGAPAVVAGAGAPAVVVVVVVGVAVGVVVVVVVSVGVVVVVVLAPSSAFGPQPIIRAARIPAASKLITFFNFNLLS